MTTDMYDANAEWYAALVAPWKEDTERTLREALGEFAGGDVIDLGSGIGSSLPVLCELGAERLFAVEPSAAMRVGLMTTIAADADLLARTTIIAGGVPDAFDQLPDTWQAATMLNAIGHLGEDARAALWSALAERLVPDGRFVLSLQPPATVAEIPWTDFGTFAVGTRQLATRGRATVLSETHVEWEMEWSLLDADGAVLETRSARHPWRVLTPDELTAEAEAYGFVLLPHGGADSFLAYELTGRVVGE